MLAFFCSYGPPVRPMVPGGVRGRLLAGPGWIWHHPGPENIIRQDRLGLYVVAFY